MVLVFAAMTPEYLKDAIPKWIRSKVEIPEKILGRMEALDLDDLTLKAIEHNQTLLAHDKGKEVGDVATDQMQEATKTIGADT